MAIALMAWLMAPAPMAWSSTRPLLRMTPAMAPATATGLEEAETLRISVPGLPSAEVNAASPMLCVYSIDTLNRSGVSGEPVNPNQYRVECHRSRRHLEAVGDSGQEALQDGLLVHADDPVAGADHAHVGHVGGASRQHPVVGGGDVGVGADHGAGAPVQVPAQGLLFGGRLAVDVAEADLQVGVAGQDAVRGLEGGLGPAEKELPHQVHDQDPLPGRLHHAVADTRRPGRVVLGPQHPLLLVEQGHELPLVEDVVAGGDHVRARLADLGDGLDGQPEASGGVLAVDDGQVRRELLAQPGQDGAQRVAAGSADDVAHEEDAELIWHTP